MAMIKFVGFETSREAEAFAEGVAWINDGSVSVIDVRRNCVLVLDYDQDEDSEIEVVFSSGKGRTL